MYDIIFNMYYFEFVELLFMIFATIYIFYLHIQFNEGICFLLSYVLFIKVVIRILVLLDRSEN